MAQADTNPPNAVTPIAAKSDTAPWDAKKGRSKKGRIRKFLMWIFILGVVAVVGYGLKPQPIEVEVGEVTHGPLTVHVVEEGKTRIRNRYVVSAPVAGQMRRVPFKAGDTIVANETVITTIAPVTTPLLDPRARAQAEARLQAADAGRDRATQAMEMARTADKFAQANWERNKGLAKSGSISVTDRDNAEREAEMRSREVRANEFAQKVAEFEWQQAKAALLQIESPESAVAGAEIEVRAPVSGRVLKVQQESAMVVTPGVAIMEIGDPSDIEIEAEILSRDAVAIKPGAEVLIEQWGGEAPLKGRVRLVEPAAFTKVSALGVEEQRVYVLSDIVDPPKDATALGDRYRVEVRVAVWQQPDVMLMPAGALFREGSAWKTFVFDGAGGGAAGAAQGQVEKGHEPSALEKIKGAVSEKLGNGGSAEGGGATGVGKARKISVDAGRTDGRMTQIIGGVELGTKVLLHPPDSVVDGVAVKARAAR